MPFSRHIWIRAATRYAKRCRDCDAHITMAQEVGTGKWFCFDVNPVATRTRTAYETGDGVHEQIDGQDLHDCARGGVK